MPQNSWWNPVKELKVTYFPRLNLCPTPEWNPVKELKVPHSQFDDLVRKAWNPVKELKVFQP